MPLRQIQSAGMSSVTGPLLERTWTGNLFFFYQIVAGVFS